MNDRRLIESAFPLKQASLDSVHEKNVRHGHISTLHVWPARRPLAASRAVLLATLLADPGTAKGRRELVRSIGGMVEEVPDKEGRLKEVTNGGVLHWGREGNEHSRSGIQLLRDEIGKAFGNRAPRVLDPFAGGGAIPLEAMRLGCEVVASDINPVAWFILRCTLHYPRLIAGQTHPLPESVVRDRAFMTTFVKAHGAKTKAAQRKALAAYGFRDEAKRKSPDRLLDGLGVKASPNADFAWHLRASGQQVLHRVRTRLASRYPTYADFEPVRRKGAARSEGGPDVSYRPRSRQLLEPDADGAVSAAELNCTFTDSYLEDERNPRWIAKPTVAYLWARTVSCTRCRKELPLLKTRWLCKRDKKRVLLTMSPTDRGVEFGIDTEADANADASGTMSGSGARCPGCQRVTTTMQDLRAAGRAGKLGSRMAAVVVDGQQGKEYRSPTLREIEAAQVDEQDLRQLFAEIPFGALDEPTPKAGIGASRAFSVDGYGFRVWRHLFTNRQLLMLGTALQELRAIPEYLGSHPRGWSEAMPYYIAAALSRTADRGSCLSTWTNDPEQIRNTFARFALPMVWDFVESCPLSDTSGGFGQAIEWIARAVEHVQAATANAGAPLVLRQSAIDELPGTFDIICTDPPYYDAIPYSDLMDFFHVWLRRALHGLSPETDAAFSESLGPKWSTEEADGELIDDAGRFGGNREASKQSYEEGMARAFARFHDALRDDGRLVIVFANKSPDAWETLVSALMRSGFVVDASWPIQTERQSRQRSLSSAALASSIWLVCRKRPKTARPGWDTRVLAEMQANISERLRDFWDAGIRGPDFVWSATGPALEAFSRHPIVKRTDIPGEQLTVADFLRHVRRMVVAFVVNQLFDDDNGATAELDDPTTYYLLHRADFGLGPAPAGACILYAVSCNLSDGDLAGRMDLLIRGGTSTVVSESDDDADAKGSEARLKPWNRRRARDMGEPGANGGPPPLIDCLHRAMRVWKTGELSRVDAYLEAQGLVKHELFARVVQAVIELAEPGSEERAILEYLQSHLASRGSHGPRQQRLVQ